MHWPYRVLFGSAILIGLTLVSVMCLRELGFVIESDMFHILCFFIVLFAAPECARLTYNFIYTKGIANEYENCKKV